MPRSAPATRTIWNQPCHLSEATQESRILVTGGAGFIGSHLCERLLAEGAEVMSVDNYFTGSRRNIAHLIANPLFEAMRHDVTFPLYIEVDAIFNLACPASPIHYQRDPVQTTKTACTARSTCSASPSGSARIFQASTSEVYGDPLMHPQTGRILGQRQPDRHRSCYDEGKRCAETLFFDYWRQHGLPIKVARIFNTYGPRMQPNDGRVVSSFIVQALKGEPITVFGDGGQTRSFCYVDDLVEAIMPADADGRGLHRTDQPRQQFGVHHSGAGRESHQLTGSRSRLVFKPLPQDDPRQRQPDLSKAKALLDWEPKVALADGLKETIAYFKRSLEMS